MNCTTLMSASASHLRSGEAAIGVHLSRRGGDEPEASPLLAINKYGLANTKYGEPHHPSWVKTALYDAQLASK